MPQYLFTYGTLRPPLAPSEVRATVRNLKPIGRGAITGKLYDLGEFPGALLQKGSKGRIIGEVFEFSGGASVLKRLDDYEGYDRGRPGQSLFVRRLVPVLLEDDRTLKCWVYEYNRSVRGARRLSGDYARKRAG